ncbi:MAG: hypothetical protein IKZ87_06200 [Actinomycetaceae bacterium]|nr:hypothetical protein [Actinomycetaceae bacterium]
MGVVWLVVTLVLHKRTKNVINYEDYVGVPRRKYWLGIALIVASVLAAGALAPLPLIRWYVDNENVLFFFISLAVPGVSLILLFAGAIRLIDDVVVNSHIAKAQQKAIV